MLNKIIAVILFIIAIAIAVWTFMNPDPLAIAFACVPVFIIVLFGVVIFRHGFKEAVRASHKGQPDHLKFK